MAIAIRTTEHQSEPHRPAAGGAVTVDDIWEHHDYLHAVSRRIVGDSASAEDIVQETYIRALRNLDRLEPGPSLRAWLATVARRCSIDELRRKGRHAVPVDELPERPRRGSDVDPLDALESRASLEAAWDALSELRPREQRLLWGQVAEGRSIADLAAAEGSTVRAVESVLTRARAKLATAIERGGALVLVPFGRLGRWMRSRAVAAQTHLDELAEGGTPPRLGATRGVEAAVAGVAVAAVLAGFVIGARSDDTRSRVEMSDTNRPPAGAFFGVDDADRVASVDPTASARKVRTLIESIGGFLGWPVDPVEDPQDPTQDGVETQWATPGTGLERATPTGGDGPGPGGGGRSAGTPRPATGTDHQGDRPSNDDGPTDDVEPKRDDDLALPQVLLGTGQAPAATAVEVDTPDSRPAPAPGSLVPPAQDSTDAGGPGLGGGFGGGSGGGGQSCGVMPRGVCDKVNDTFPNGPSPDSPTPAFRQL